MKQLALGLVFFCVAFAAAPAWAAGPDAVRLADQPALGPDLAAFPRIAAPDDPATRRRYSAASIV